MSDVEINVQVEDKLQGNMHGGIWVTFKAVREDSNREIFAQTLRIKEEVVQDLRTVKGKGVIQKIKDEAREDTLERAKTLLKA